MFLLDLRQNTWMLGYFRYMFPDLYNLVLILYSKNIHFSAKKIFIFTNNFSLTFLINIVLNTKLNQIKLIEYNLIL